MRPPPQGLMVGRGALGVRSRSDSWWVKTQSLYSLDPCAGAARRPVIGCPSKLPFDSLSSVKGISTCALPFLSLSLIRLKLEETREVQNLRKRPNGVRWVLLGSGGPRTGGDDRDTTSPNSSSPSRVVVKNIFSDIDSPFS